MADDQRQWPGPEPSFEHGEPALDTRGNRRDSVGRTLRRAREREGWDLHAVAEDLRIRYDYLDAIERSDFDRLPGMTYAVGFVRGYASHLELDETEIVRRFKEEAAGLDRAQDLHFPEPVNEGKMPGGALLLISLLLIGVAYGGWYFLSNRETSLAEMAPEVPERLQALLDSGNAEPSDNNTNTSTFATEKAVETGASNTGTGTQTAATETQGEGAAPSGPTAVAESEPANTPPSTSGGAPGSTSSSTPVRDDGTENAGTGNTAPPAPGEDVAAGTTQPGTTAADTDAAGGTAANGTPPSTESPDVTEIPASGTSPVEVADALDPAVTAAPRSTETAALASDQESGASTVESGGAAVDAGDAGNGIPEPPSAAPDAGGNGTTSAEMGAGDREAGAQAPPEAGADAAASINAPETGALPEVPQTASVGNDNRSAQTSLLAEAERVFGQENTESRVLLEATQDSWVQVRGADNSLLLTRVLNPGEVYRVPNRGGLVLHTGNAGGLRIYLDGRQLGGLGESGEVRRNISLAPAELR